MDFDEFIQDLDRRSKKLQSTEVLARVATGVASEMMVRIFERGEDSSGGKIGAYDSTNELWVDPARLPRKVAPRSKPGSNRTAQKTVYFSSYKALRSQQGRESGFVNLRLTNDLQSDMANSSVSAGGDAVAAANPIKVNDNQYVLKLRRRENIEKRKGLEAKYGKIFDPTKVERELFQRSYETEIKLAYA